MSEASPSVNHRFEVPSEPHNTEPTLYHRLGGYVISRQALVKYLYLQDPYTLPNNNHEEHAQDDVYVAMGHLYLDFDASASGRFLGVVIFQDLDGEMKFLACTRASVGFGRKWCRDVWMADQFIRGKREKEAEQSLLALGLNEDDFGKFKTVLANYSCEMDDKIRHYEGDRKLEELKYKARKQQQHREESHSIACCLLQ